MVSGTVVNCTLEALGLGSKVEQQLGSFWRATLKRDRQCHSHSAASYGHITVLCGIADHVLV